MKPISKMTLIVLVAGLFGILIIVFASSANRKKIKRESHVPSVSEKSLSASVPDVERMHSERTNATHLTNAVPVIVATNLRPFDVALKIRAKSFSPKEIGYKPTIKTIPPDVMLPLMNAVSNAVSSVDRILQSKHYRNVEQFDQIIWLESVDEAQSTIWRIVPDWSVTPEGTNAVVGAIEAIVYQNAEMIQKDLSRSFKMVIFPENGTLKNFFWADKHEMLVVEAGSGSVDYARDLGGKKRLVIGWDVNGTMVSSNVYDWATRGRPIGGTPHAKGLTGSSIKE